MCVGIPVQVLKVDGIAGHTTDGKHHEVVDLSLTPQAEVGDWVLTFLGVAREIITEDEALKITAALGGLQSLMRGEDLGDAFADLDDRTPSLPPHLQAALDAGKTSA